MMKGPKFPWVYIVACETAEPPEQGPMLAFHHVYVMATDADEAYGEGHKAIDKIGRPPRMLNDYVVPIGQQ
jgi:hypothetical protein